jgi:hypothetical protein
MKKQDDRADLCAENPYSGLTPITSSASPFGLFRQTCTLQQLAQLTCFLFQVVIQLVIHWEPSEELRRHWGEGESTAPRRALLYHHTAEATDSHVQALANVERKLFARVVREGENIKEVETEADQAWRQDLVLQVSENIKKALASRGKQLVLEEKLPPLNLTLPEDKLHEQYDQEMWKADLDPRKKRVV